MAAPQQSDQALFAVIGDEDSITGFLLAGVGNVDLRKKSNFLLVNDKTPTKDIEDAFKSFTSREDIAIVLINQHCADLIRHLLDVYSKVCCCCSGVVPCVYDVAIKLPCAYTRVCYNEPTTNTACPCCT